MAQINKMGGPRSERLLRITKDLWNYCLSKKITLTAEYLPGVLNTIADRESRVFVDKSSWMLPLNIITQIEKHWGVMNIDLFADRLTARKPKYVSWKPDPGAIALDAFSIQWNTWKPYAFPTFCLIGRCLAKIKQDQTDLTIITPVWQTQHWYPLLLEMSIAQPILLPPDQNLLTSPQGQPHPLVRVGGLRLAAWRVSGIDSRQKVFLRDLPAYSWNPGDQVPNLLTEAPGINGVAGALQNKLIRFMPLWTT